MEAVVVMSTIGRHVRASLAFDTIVCMYITKILLWYHQYLLYIAFYIVFKDISRYWISMYSR